MCQFLSAFVHDDAATLEIGSRYLFGDLHSHSATMNLHGLKYGDPDCWREFEWTGEGKEELVVRGRDDKQSDRLRAQIIRDAPRRIDLFSLMQFPADLKFPKGCKVIR